MNEYIYLIVGASGSGKTTVVNILQEKYGWKSVDSYTTRPPRSVDETGHIFVTKEEFDSFPKVAYTLFNGYEYGATREQVDNADVYVIDLAGLEYFLTRYDGHKTPIVVALLVSEGNALYNMIKRGDDLDSALSRSEHDQAAFKDLEKRLQFTEIEYLTYKSDEQNTPDVIAQVIYEHRRWKEIAYENL